MTKNSVESYVKGGLCSGCGTCVSSCPISAISLSVDEKKGAYIPEIRKDACIDCGACRRVCPSNYDEIASLNDFAFNKQPEDLLAGNLIRCYTGHSQNEEIRYNSSSGGLITQILIYALDQGLIDGALVTRMNKSKPLEPEPFIARTREEIIEASRSKYCPVPLNAALKQILDCDEKERFAVVGLPCHIYGIRRAEMASPILKDRICLHLGLVCNHSPSLSAIEFLLDRLGVDREEVIELNYRGEGWPGSMTVVTRDEKKTLPQFSPLYWGFLYSSFFYPLRCSLCYDKACTLSDASFADAWNIDRISEDTAGTSLVISRSPIFEEILHGAISDNEVEVNQISEELALHSLGLASRKRVVDARYNLRQLLGLPTPLGMVRPSDTASKDYINAALFYFRSYLSQERQLWCSIRAYESMFMLARRLKVSFKGRLKADETGKAAHVKPHQG